MSASGKFLCLITLGVGFGAVNTGNNLLFLLLGMLLALILASGVLSEAVLRRVEARRKLPIRLVAGTGAPGAYLVRNDKTFASLSVECIDRTARCVEGPFAGEVVGPETISWWKVWRKAPEEPPIASAYAMRLEGESDDALDARWCFPRRGRYRMQTLRITTRFPFGLFEKSRRIDDDAEVVVFPAGTDAADWIATVWGQFGEVPSDRRGLGEDYFGLREYRAGEDRRKIHWKSSARRGELVVRENEALVQREVEIVFCDWTGDETPTAEELERGVSKTVGLIGALVDRGWRVGLRTRDHVVQPAVGSTHVDRMLAELAIVEFDGEPASFEEHPTMARIAVGPSAALRTLSSPVDLALPFDAEDADG